MNNPTGMTREEHELLIQTALMLAALIDTLGGKKSEQAEELVQTAAKARAARAIASIEAAKPKETA